MKKKALLWSLIIAVPLIILLVILLSGGVKYESFSGKINPKNDTTIGKIKKNGTEIVISSGTLKDETSIDVKYLKSSEVAKVVGMDFIVEPLNITLENNEHILSKDAKVKIKLPKNIKEKDYFNVMGAYFDGQKWEYIYPSLDELEKGYLEFETPHFSIFAPVKLSKEEAIDRYAETLATQNVVTKEQEQLWFEDLADCYSETLDKIGITDETAQGVIIQTVLKENKYGELLVSAKNGEINDFNATAVEILMEGLMLEENKYLLSGAIAGAEKLFDGDLKGAYKEFVSSGMEYFPTYRGAKAVVKAVEAGIVQWQDYSLESAYKVYLDNNIGKDGSINHDEWFFVFNNMGSGLDYTKRSYYKTYAMAHEMTVKDIEKDKKLKDRLDTVVEENIKKSFMRKYVNEKKILDEKEKIKDQIELFDEHGLLEPNVYLKYYENMSIVDRLDSLMRIRQNILNIVDGDISVFGSKSKREDNLAFAIKMWLGFGKDRGKFYKWMQENGYLAKNKKETEGYWKLSKTFNNEFETSKSSDNYAESWSGGNGHYTYKSTFTGSHWYTASNHDDCHGEYVENVGTISPPKGKYYGGEKVVLDLSIKANTSTPICLNMGAEMWAVISSINKDDPFVNYGTDTDFLDVSEENSTGGGVRTSKNDTNTGYNGMSRKSGATMPKGSVDGDKVYIVITFGGGNNLIKTAFEYTWHTK